MAMALRALIIEDDRADAELVIRELGRERAVTVEVVATAKATREALTRSRWDFILADWSLPGFGALDALAIVRELSVDAPVIIVSGSVSEEVAVSAMRAGARDFVRKDHLSRLVPAIERELHEAETRAARRRAEREVHDSAERYRQLFESSPLPMWVYDTDTLGFLAVNNAAIRRYGYSREEFLARALTDLRPAEDHARLRQDVAVRDDSPRIWRHLTKHGDTLAVEITAHDLEFEGRRARLVLANDVTRRERLEDQLRQSQKMEAVGRLAGGIAHDFNNILSVILSYSETLLDTLSPGEMREDIEQIRSAGQRGAALTRQLLMFNRQQLVEPRVLQLNDVLADMTRMLQRLLRADIELSVRAAPDLGAIHADQGSIEQVVMNLVVNAGDAMPTGGKLTVATSNREIDRRHAEEHPGVTPGRYVVLEVRDTGSGMDAATLARIFEPFFTTKERGRGTGLGLSVVFGIVQQFGGHIGVDSEPGTGTTFQVHLPRVDAIAAAPTLPRRSAMLYGSETVLLVEDDRQVREVALAILRRHGYVVIAACDGDEAVRSCEAHPHPIHLLLTDMVMPGITGHELARRLLRIRPEMKVLCMSGYSEVDTAAPDAELARLQKPFTAESLATSVRQVLDGGCSPTGSQG
jgi:two-component system cell cycle sensor histidine kinase/response regulator CckA